MSTTRSTDPATTESPTTADEEHTGKDEEYTGENEEHTGKDEESTETKADRLAAYLKQRAADGDCYFKSKFIADDVDLSPKEIGALIVKLQESREELSIERWSYTGATTWRVEPL